MRVPDGQNQMLGTIVDASYLGVSTSYIVEARGGGLLTVYEQNVERATRAELWEPGEEVRMTWSPDHTFAVEAGGAPPPDVPVGGRGRRAPATAPVPPPADRRLAPQVHRRWRRRPSPPSAWPRSWPTHRAAVAVAVPSEGASAAPSEGGAVGTGGERRARRPPPPAGDRRASMGELDRLHRHRRRRATTRRSRSSRPRPASRSTTSRTSTATRSSSPRACPVRSTPGCRPSGTSWS